MVAVSNAKGSSEPGFSAAPAAVEAASAEPARLLGTGLLVVAGPPWGGDPEGFFADALPLGAFIDDPQNGHSVASSSSTDCPHAGQLGRSM